MGAMTSDVILMFNTMFFKGLMQLYTTQSHASARLMRPLPHKQIINLCIHSRVI